MSARSLLRYCLLGVGLFGSLSVLTIFLPHTWMQTASAFFGVGELPRTPVVGYLARTASVMYLLLSLMALGLATDLDRYRPLVRLFARLITLHGVCMLGIDLSEGMPTWWILSEGIGGIVFGVILIALESRMTEPVPMTTPGTDPEVQG